MKAPSLDPYEAHRLENDVIGVRLWGGPTRPTLSIGKSDLWDRRWFGDRQPLVTMDRIRECALSGRLGEIVLQDNNHTVYDVYNKYATPCPKPGVQLILGVPFAERAGVRARDGELGVHLEGRGKKLDVGAWVHLSRPLVVLELSATGMKGDELWAGVYRHRDTIIPGSREEPPRIGPHALPEDAERLPLPRCFSDGGEFGIVQDLGRDMTFGRGFSFAAVCRATGAEYSIDCVEGERGLGTPYLSPEEGRLDHGVLKRYTPINEATGSLSRARFGEPPESWAILATLMTSQDGEDPVKAARDELEEAFNLGIPGLREEQERERSRATRRTRAQAVLGEVEVAAPPGVYPRLRVPGGYYGDVPLCSVDSTKFCFQDASLWHADFHLNEIRAEPMLTLGQFEELYPYCEMISGLLPQAMENARDVYSLPGAMYPLVHFPLRCRGVVHTNLTWEQDMGINGLVAKPLWLYYRYTGDRKFLRAHAYPVLRECSRFIHSYLEEGEDGRLHITPTVSPEHWGITPGFERNRNCTSALSLSKYLLRAAAGAADILGVDAGRAREWRESARKMAPYPTHSTDRGPVWVDVQGAPPIEYNIPVPLAPIFWGDDVGLDSEPGVLEIAHRTLDQIRVWKPHSGYLDRSICPRLGVLRPGAPIGPENLLLSYQSIRIFPAVPDSTEITMENFAAEGGFRVSAARTGGNEVRDVKIHSNLGGPCRLANPWPGDGARVRGSDVDLESRSSIITFETRPDETYELGPGSG